MSYWLIMGSAVMQVRFFAFTLCNDESVKGISMMPGHRDCLTGVFFFNR